MSHASPCTLTCGRSTRMTHGPAVNLTLTWFSTIASVLSEDSRQNSTISRGPLRSIAGISKYVSVQGEAWDVPGRRIEGTFDQITVLKVDGDKILHHVDHVDYAEVMEVVDAARATIR